jgi:nucleoside-diphosphate-sugar epimerase
MTLGCGHVEHESDGVHYLITGGAGFLGINLVRYWLRRGHRVRSLDIAPFEYSERGQVGAMLGDIRDPLAMQRAAAGVDAIVHAAAALPLYPEADILSTNIDGTRRVLEAAVAAGVSRVIFISSTAVYGIPDHHPIVEDDPLSGVGPYGRSKIAGEAICAEFRARGLCVPVLRPKSFVGPERLGAFELLYDWAASGHNFPVLGSGKNRYQLLDVEDLCTAIDLCAARERPAVDETFNVGAVEFGSMREDFQAVLDHAGHGKRIVPIPVGPAIWLLRASAALRISPLYPWIFETAHRDSFVAVDHIRDRLGFTPRYSNREALIRNFDWYVANRGKRAPAAGVSHRLPWRHGMLDVAKLFF